MKKILVGICGIGNGHLERQLSICHYLSKKYTSSILIATQHDKVPLLQQAFPTIHVIEVSIPWIACTSFGIDYKNSLLIHQANTVDYLKSFLEFCLSVEDFFDGKPDFVISDYEPNSAWYAYSATLPLISMEQQAKFLYLPSVQMENHSSLEEISRINYFFPAFYARIISSFFPIDITAPNVYVTSPIIENLEKKKLDTNHVLVYFSPYSNSDIYKKILTSVKSLSDYHFDVYSKFSEYYSQKYASSNISYKSFGKQFKEDLQNSCAVLTSAGHQLISESISLELPLFVYPLDTYEQAYNAHMVEFYHLGVNSSSISSTSIQTFLDEKSLYAQNISSFKKFYANQDWQITLSHIIESI